MNHVIECTGYEMLVQNITKAEGYYLFDATGKRYIDLESGVWCTALGHNHPQITKALKKQLDQITHLGFQYSSQLVEHTAVDVLSTLTSFSGKCLFLNSGSEAVEFGVKVAKALHPNQHLLTFKESYLSAYGSSGSRSDGEWIKLELGRCLACSNDFHCSQCKVLDELPFEKIGVFAFEPGNSSGLVLLPPKPLIEEIAKRIRANDGLIVVDEVTTGVGRTGTWYGFQHYQMEPDIIALGKGIGNGYPVSVAVVNDYIANEIEARNIRHSQSHQNDALGCAVISEVIKVLKEHNLIQQSHNTGQYFFGKLHELKNLSSTIKEVRGRGLMIAVEFHPEAKDVLDALHKRLIAEGYLPGYKPAFNLIRFYPSLTITREDIDQLIITMMEVLLNC